MLTLSQELYHAVNAMHKAKAMELVKAEVLCIMLELCRALFQPLSA